MPLELSEIMRRRLLAGMASALFLPALGLRPALAEERAEERKEPAPSEGADSGQPKGKSQGLRPASWGQMDAPTAHEKAMAGEIILVDIRTPPEWAQTGIGEGALAINMRDPEFVKALVVLRQLNPEKPIALICRTGNRSGYVVKALAQQGFPGLVDVPEGMAGSKAGPGWLKRGLPTYPGKKEEIVKRLKAAFEQPAAN